MRVDISPPSHHTALDGLRGWAAFAVVLYHCVLSVSPNLTDLMIQPATSLGNLSDAWAWSVLALANGSFAVTLFFILSGLVLAESLERQKHYPLPALFAAFAVRRIVRLMPALIAAVVLAYLIGNALASLGIVPTRVRSLSQLWDNLTLLNFSVNGATWTIQVEILVIPFLCCAFLLQRLGGPIMAVAVLILAIYAVPKTTIFGSLVYLNDALMAFAVGWVIAQPWAKQACASSHRSIAWLFLLVFAFVRPVAGWGDHAVVVVQILTGGALIGNLAASPSSLASLLNSRLSQFLGRISYSFYLLNVPLIWIFGSMTLFGADHGWPILTGIVLSAIVIATTIPLAMLSARYIEHPSIALGKRASGWILARATKRRTVAAGTVAAG